MGILGEQEHEVAGAEGEKVAIPRERQEVLLLMVPNLKWGIPLFLAFALISLAAAFRQGPMEALITEVVHPDRRGTFIALKNSFSQLGIAAAAFVSGLLFEWKGYLAVCWLCAAANLLAAAAMALLVRDRSL